jgi:hypothetical protein
MRARAMHAARAARDADSCDFRKLTARFHVFRSAMFYARLVMNRSPLHALITCSLAALAVALNTTSASAALISVDAIDTGAYQANGSHTSTNQNYVTGRFNNETRSFFVFDLTGLSAPITSATLNLWNPNTDPHPCCQGYRSPDATETFNLFDVNAPITTLTGGGAGLTNVFADLGTGATFGSYTASKQDNGKTIAITFNTAGIAALNASLGQIIAFGGALSTIGGAGDQFLFGFSTVSFAGGDVRRLDLTTEDLTQVPEPATLTLLGIGITGIVARRRRQA